MTKQFAQVTIELSEEDFKVLYEKKRLSVFCDLKVDLVTKVKQ